MAYQVIARKYRPQRFQDVVGQEHVTQTLANAIEQKRIAHAYLFCGPRGTGKTTIARIFAKCLNCSGGPKVDFADDDPRCQEITEGRSLDVLEIDGASNRGIDEIRELRETVKYAPATSRFKIYIVDEVHMLTKEAFNALLKTLEEPPEHVKFMFATTEPEKVLPTILSRCQRFDLRRIPVSLIVRHLAEIAGREKVKIDEAALHAIARGADGGMRDAESALDQLISFCGDKIVESDVLSMFGLTAQKQILAVARGVITGEAETVLRELDELTRHGKDLGRLLSDLLNHFRNLLIFQVAAGDLKLIEVSEAEAASLQEQAALISVDALTRVMEVLTDAEGRLRDAASKKIFLEVALLKAIQARQALHLETVLKQLQQMRGEQPRPASTAAPQPLPAPTPAPRRVKEPSKVSATVLEPPALEPVLAAATATPEASLDQLWQEVLEAAGRVSAFTRSYLVEARPVSLANKVLTLGFDPEFADHLELVNNPRTHSLLQTKLQELGHPQVQIKFVQAEASVGHPTPASAPAVQPAPPIPSTPSVPPQPPSPAPATGTNREKVAPVKLSAEEFKKDPLIQKALEIFKGQIVEVRA
jgi:DNA polymerase-3 subunit gamma/tau